MGNWETNNHSTIQTGVMSFWPKNLYCSLICWSVQICNKHATWDSSNDLWSLLSFSQKSQKFRWGIGYRPFYWMDFEYRKYMKIPTYLPKYNEKFCLPNVKLWLLMRSFVNYLLFSIWNKIIQITFSIKNYFELENFS